MLDTIYNPVIKSGKIANKETYEKGKILERGTVYKEDVLPKYGGTWVSITGCCISKVSVIQFTKVIPLELSRNNMQINVVFLDYFCAEKNKTFLESKKGKQYIKEYVSLKDVGGLKEFESTVVYFVAAPVILIGAQIIFDGVKQLFKWRKSYVTN